MHKVIWSIQNFFEGKKTRLAVKKLFFEKKQNSAQKGRHRNRKTSVFEKFRNYFQMRPLSELPNGRKKMKVNVPREQKLRPDQFREYASMKRETNTKPRQNIRNMFQRTNVEVSKTFHFFDDFFLEKRVVFLLKIFMTFFFENSEKFTIMIFFLKFLILFHSIRILFQIPRNRCCRKVYECFIR